MWCHATRRKCDFRIAAQAFVIRRKVAMCRECGMHMKIDVCLYKTVARNREGNRPVRRYTHISEGWYQNASLTCFLGSVMSHLIPVHTLTPSQFKTQFKIIHLLCRLIGGLVVVVIIIIILFFFLFKLSTCACCMSHYYLCVFFYDLDITWV
jgi:hypothetical protein